MSSFDQDYLFVCETARKAMIYQTSAETLEWDERTGMPPHGGDYRAQQVAALRGHAHQLRTGARYGEALERLSDQTAGSVLEATNVRELRRDYQRDQRLPQELVESASEMIVKGQQAWEKARHGNDYAGFAPVLKQIIALKQDIGARLAEGTDQSPYEALMDEYEPGAKTSELAPVFENLKGRLATLIGELADGPTPVDVSLLKATTDTEAQKRFVSSVCQAVGFDFQRGRLDETSHPFCTTLGPSDCRILSRYEANWFPAGIYAGLHEAGHGMYEQGLDQMQFALPMGSYASLGVHESQSRLWENQVGRSRSFITWVLPQVQATFPNVFGTCDVETLYRCVNHVQPRLIRVEADEATYNLHIAIRFELEQQLIAGDVSVDDLPEAWNAQYQQTLGIMPDSDANGVLQDVHWSAGLIGYFPTYTLGNLIAAQLFDHARAEITGLDQDIERGEFSGLLGWLQTNVHSHGRRYSSLELVRQVTGKGLSSDHLLDQLEGKLKPIYGI